MGRTFENRKQAMAKRGDRDAKNFTRVGRQINIAVKSGGSDPDGNPALRRALQNARSVNMPKDRVKAAIDKAAGVGDTQRFEQILYEGYGPHGVAVLVETATDNLTRTVANIRSHFKKGGGTMGSSGSVAFMFEQVGVFRLDPDGLDRESLELELIDHGLEELLDGEDDQGESLVVLRCSRTSFGELQSALEARNIDAKSSGFEWIPQTTTELTDEQLEDVTKLFERLENDDDVQEVFTNISYGLT
ncbi:MAG: YebC/PmpR family DNA-binding transcriptional regulator [Myxococcales bacterium]|nr:YebC/PmpR family DNA-binding transcriptional regulator [Myxococcales bacterium]